MGVFRAKLSSYLQQGNLIKVPAWEYFQNLAVNLDTKFKEILIMSSITLLSTETVTIQSRLVKACEMTGVKLDMNN